MSNYHVLEINDKKDTARVAFHIAVPDESNTASINIRTALMQHTTPSSAIPFIESSEAAQIEAGELYEHIEAIEFNANLTATEKRTIIDNRYKALATIIPNRIRERYSFWGLSRDVT